MRYRLAVLTIALFPTLAAASPMSGDDIRADIAGRAVYLAVPLGGEFPLNYRPGGRVDGNGEALGLGRYLAPKDTGRWWISGDQLCQRFTKWYDGAQSCFRLTRTGPRSLNWVRDNGQTGTARIGAAIGD
ncbi:hypothetical protein E8L99_06210 [Phreatobacter aquaticus]|uniref:Uncharacterized protein n=1 Tax=Phreatobacter aquaticus TaxID=2570229 RepID=A0A4D7QBG7_9HYPH|nr:hypothetical protein [Phreatobacter aquaticus]QCK85390.1 hypothetical protein E8L99_06210 [Phreatobacter aquaticus]